MIHVHHRCSQNNIQKLKWVIYVPPPYFESRHRKCPVLKDYAKVSIRPTCLRCAPLGPGGGDNRRPRRLDWPACPRAPPGLQAQRPPGSQPVPRNKAPTSRFRLCHQPPSFLCAQVGALGSSRAAQLQPTAPPPVPPVVPEGGLNYGKAAQQ